MWSEDFAVLMSDLPVASGPVAPSSDFLRAVRRRLNLVIATIVTVMVIAVILLLVISPRYQATADVRVDVQDEPVPGDQSAWSVRDAELLRAYQISTQIEALKSPAVARQTAISLALFDDPEFNPQASDGPEHDKGSSWSLFGRARADRLRAHPAVKSVDAIPPQLIMRVIDRLQQVVTIAQEGQSSFIKVSATSTSPAKAARIANKITTTYINGQIKERRERRERMIQALTLQVDDLRQRLLATEQAIATYRQVHRIDFGPRVDASAAAMSRTASELAATRGQVAEANTRIGSQTGEVASRLLVDLRGQETTVARRVAELSALYGPKHPDMVIARAELAQVRAGIAAETNRIASQLENDAQAQRAREAQLAHDLSSLKADSYASGMAGVPLADLERSATATQTVYNTLLTRLKELRGQVGPMHADASIASAAFAPTSPAFPRPGAVLGTAAGTSIILSFFVVMLAESLDGQVRTASQVKSITGLPVFAMVPELLSRRLPWSAESTVANKPYSAFAEAVRTAHSKLMRHLPGTTGNVVLVTSPLPGDGKTTIATGLAAAAVALGRSAVIVDLDLRRPGLPGFALNADAPHDLYSYLSGEAELDEIIVSSVALPGLNAVLARSPAQDPGAVLTSPRMSDLIDDLRARFDLIVINTPPVIGVSDAQVMAAHSDAVLLILRWGRTTADLLETVMAQFDMPIIGAVINRVKLLQHGRMGYGDQIQHYRRNLHAYRTGLKRLAQSRARKGGETGMDAPRGP